MTEALAHRLPPGIRADGEMTQTGVICAFVLGTMAVFAALPLGILAVVLNCMGMDRVATKPELARKLVIWSWGIFVTVDVLAIAGIVALTAG